MSGGGLIWSNTTPGTGTPTPTPTPAAPPAFTLTPTSANPTGADNWMSGFASQVISTPDQVRDYGQTGGDQWGNTIPQVGAYYEDPWHVTHSGLLLDKDGNVTADPSQGVRAWFTNFPTSERTGTAALSYGWKDPAWASQNVQQSAYSGDDGYLLGQKLPKGSQGWSIPVSELPTLASQLSNESASGNLMRNNGQYANHDTGLGGFAALLSIAATAFGQPWLSGVLAGGTATLATDVAAGAIIGGGTSALTGGDPLKGAVMGGIGGAWGGSDLATTIDKTIGDSLHFATDSFGQRVINGAVSGAVSGGSGAVLNGGSFGDVIKGTAVGATGGALGAAANSLVFNQTGSKILAGGVGGAVNGGTTAGLNGGNVENAAIAAGVGGATGGAVSTLGGNDTVANAAGKIASTLTGQALNPINPGTPQLTTTGSPATAPITPPTQNQGLGFGDTVLAYTPVARTTNWATPRVQNFG